MAEAKQPRTVDALIYGGRRYPGLCANEACTVSGGDVTLFTDRAGLKIAHIKCQTCGEKWKRVGE